MRTRSRIDKATQTWRRIGKIQGRAVMGLYWRENGRPVLHRETGRPITTEKAVLAQVQRDAAATVRLRFSVGGTEYAALERSLRELPRRAHLAIARKAMQRWAPRTLAIAMALAPESHRPYWRYFSPSRAKAWEMGGFLMRAMTSKVASYRGVVYGLVGPEYSRGLLHPAGWRVHYAEGGFYNRKLRRRFPGRHMLQKAGRATAPGLVSDVEQAIDEAIRKAGLADRQGEGNRR